MPTMPPCANCGGTYERGHLWASKARSVGGACKNPPPGQKTFCRKPSDESAGTPQKAGA